MAAAKQASANLSAADTWTGVIAAETGVVTLIISETGSAAVTLQFSLDGGKTWADALRADGTAAYTSPGQFAIHQFEAAVIHFRAGIKAGARVTGSVSVRIAQ